MINYTQRCPTPSSAAIAVVWRGKGGWSGRRGGTIGRNRDKLTALITARLNQTFPRSVSNRHRMATDSLFRRYSDGSRIIDPDPQAAFYIYSKTVNRCARRGDGGGCRVEIFKFTQVEQVRAVASIGENRSKLYATVIVHYFYRLFLFPLYFSPRGCFHIYIYICFELSLALFFIFSLHVRMFAKKRKKKKENRDISILNSYKYNAA